MTSAYNPRFWTALLARRPRGRSHAMPTLLRHMISAVALGAACAAQAGGSGENSYFAELPTVLTVSRLPQAQNEAPGAVTVIDRALIRALGYQDLARVLRLVPGMQVGQERGNSQWVSYHGLSSTYPSEMQVLIDGRSVYSPSTFGGVDWSALPLSIDEIDRIEVVRGSNAVTYGANAFLGVINIITRHSAEAPGEQGAVTAGSRGIGGVSAGLSRAEEGLGWRLNADIRRDEGFAGLHDDHRNATLSMRSDYQLDVHDELSLRVAASGGRKQLGYTDSPFGANDAREARYRNYILHGEWRHARAEGGEWALRYYRNQDEVDEAWDATLPPYSPLFPAGASVPLNRNRSAVRDHLEFEQRWQPGGVSQAVWGAELRRDRVDAPFLYAQGAPGDQDLYRLFANHEWKFAPGWQTTTGAALEQYRGEPLRLAPRAFLNWLPADAHAWRIGYARAWLQKPVFEQQGDVRAYEPDSGVLISHPYVANGDVRQARIDSMEVGYLGRSQVLDSRLDVRLFHERIRDYIYRQATASDRSPLLATELPPSHYVNHDRPVTLTGVEYQLRLQPWSSGQWLLSHTLIRARSGSDAIDDRVAPYTASFTWMQAYPRGWSSTMSVLRMGPLAGGDGFSPLAAYVAKPYTTVDLRLAWGGRVEQRSVQISLNAINLGERHQEIADRAQESRGTCCPANRVSPMVWLGVELGL
ncbi:MAG: TonB-dependent receptor [Candidatus Dactylopiibacterium carminicum]|uniref:TonB-dependent receptor n=2 Tax=Candidatus Dactylopiibacterium carminicum TaxID=857335 RepID=A0A272EZ70_9RHOO|nr:TonB-dependent receptor [Candidatus Dactylopiibacterium carminicum]PAS95336.1 MAG: TonB-dependent receptor [Candidatus Dactylopiibacterium carminicum]